MPLVRELPGELRVQRSVLDFAAVQLLLLAPALVKTPDAGGRHIRARHPDEAEVWKADEMVEPGVRHPCAVEPQVSEGGEAFLLAKGELRVPLRRSLEAGLFVDLGNLWLDPLRFRLVDLRANAGFGLRFVTPIGPAALDFGFNVDPDGDVNERVFAPHFTIGLF